jgi:hypothetical protein
MATLSESSIECAWALVARGLHIHRYYLHVDPMLSRRLAAKLHTLAETLDPHGFDPGHPDGWQPALLEALPVAALPIATRQVRDWGPAAARGIVLHAPLEAALVRPVASEPALVSALSLVEARDIGWLVQLTAGVLEITPRPGPRFQPRVVSIDLDNEPSALADELIRRGAVQLLNLFALARHEHSALEWESAEALLAPLVPFLEPLYAPFTAALAAPPSAGPAEDEPELLKLMDAAINAVNYLPFTDLLETTLPSARRFQKFAAGLAPGQHA